MKGNTDIPSRVPNGGTVEPRTRHALAGGVCQKVMEELARKGVVIPPVQDFTCNSCELRPECEYAWDLYNVEGDCLAAK